MNKNPTPEQYPQPQQPRPIQVAMSNVKPYVTYALLGVTVFIYLIQLAGLYLLKTDVVALIGVKDDTLISAGQLWRLITPVFLHNSDLSEFLMAFPIGILVNPIVYIAFNMRALFIYGRGIESRFGHVRFLLLYLLSGFAGNVLSFLLTPYMSMGASTAIFGLIAAEGVFIIQNRKLLGNHVNRSLMNLLFFAAINLLFGFLLWGVDNYGHLGGLLGGLLFTWFGGPRRKL